MSGYPGAPAYFRRIYDRRGMPEMVQRPGVVFIDTVAGKRLVIYGKATRSRFAEDLPREDEAWRTRRAFQADCFSPIVPGGEPGFVPAFEVEEISEAEFEAAREAGWPQDV